MKVLIATAFTAGMVWLMLTLTACNPVQSLFPSPTSTPTSTATNTPTSTPTFTPTSTSTPTVTPTPTPPHMGQSAATLLLGLKAKGLPVGEYINYTAANDGNQLLGRPFQYTGKVNFQDTRIAATGDHGVNLDAQSDGGSIEVFGTTADAQSRYNYLQKIGQSSSLFVEYDYVEGFALLRISRSLTPDQAKAYEAAFKSLP